MLYYSNTVFHAHKFVPTGPFPLVSTLKVSVHLRSLLSTVLLAALHIPTLYEFII